MNGWIKLYRQLQECPIWYGERFSKGQAWVDLLMLANHSDKKIVFNGEFITIQRGQYLTSMIKLSEKWKWNRKTVSSFLKFLENDKMITKVTDNTKTLITIVNYGIYQSENENAGQPINQPNGQPIGQQQDNQTDNLLDTNKNDKNDEEKEEIIITESGIINHSDIQSILNTWNELEQYGIKAVKKLKNTTERYDRLSARIKEYGIADVLAAIENIKQSDFLQGKNNRGWTITFDWFVRPNNFPKVLEGNYTNKGDDSNGCIRRNDTKSVKDPYAEELERLLNE